MSFHLAFVGRLRLGRKRQRNKTAAFIPSALAAPAAASTIQDDVHAAALEGSDFWFRWCYAVLLHAAVGLNASSPG